MKNKLTLESAQLKTLLERAISVIPAKSTLQMLECVSLTAKNGKLSVYSTDQQMAFFSEIAVDGEGMALVDGKTLYSLLSLLNGTVSITFLPKQIEIQSGTKKYKLSSAEGEMPDLMKNFKPEGTFKINASFLPDLLSVSFCASQNPFNTLANVLLECKENELRVVGADSPRLARKTKAIKSADFSLCCPPSLIPVILKTFPDEEELTIRYSASQIEFSDGDTTIISSLFDAKYPNYEILIRDKANDILEIEIDRREMLAAMKRASLFTDDIKLEGNRKKFSKTDLRFIL